MSELCQEETHAPHQMGSLFDHFVGSAEKRLRHRKAERLGGLGGSKPVSFEAEAPSPCLRSVCALVDATLGLRDALKLALIMKVSPNGTGV